MTSVFLYLRMDQRCMYDGVVITKGTQKKGLVQTWQE